MTGFQLVFHQSEFCFKMMILLVVDTHSSPLSLDRNSMHRGPALPNQPRLSLGCASQGIISKDPPGSHHCVLNQLSQQSHRTAHSTRYQNQKTNKNQLPNQCMTCSEFRNQLKSPSQDILKQIERWFYCMFLMVVGGGVKCLPTLAWRNSVFGMLQDGGRPRMCLERRKCKVRWMEKLPRLQ